MRIIAFIEQPEVIEQILTHLPACADGRQGALAYYGPQPAGGVPVAAFPATGHHRIGPQNDPTHPDALVRPSPPGEILHEPPGLSVPTGSPPGSGFLA
jgi:hypothetical protein